MNRNELDVMSSNVQSAQNEFAAAMGMVDVAARTVERTRHLILGDALAAGQIDGKNGEQRQIQIDSALAKNPRLREVMEDLDSRRYEMHVVDAALDYAKSRLRHAGMYVEITGDMDIEPLNPVGDEEEKLPF